MRIILAFLTAVTLFAADQIRLGIRVIPSGGGGGSALTLAYQGAFRVNSGATRGDFDCGWGYMTGRRVSGVNHILHSTGCAEDVFAFAPIEMTDPVSAGSAGSYVDSATLSALPIATLVTNWGKTGGGSSYDFWDKTSYLGQTFNSSGTPTSLGTLGTDYFPHGMTWNDNGSGTCCMYMTYGMIYGLYPDTGVGPNNTFAWNIIGVDIAGGQGSVAPFGPGRICSGSYGGSEQCGVSRAAAMWRMPDGSFGHGSSQNSTQQGSSSLKVNPGPSFFASSAWPQPGDTYGWGSTRGTSAYRTTDILSTSYLAHYANNVDNATGQASAPIKMFLRPKITAGTTTPTYAGGSCSEEDDGFYPYCYEGRCTGSTSIAENPNIEVDPGQYSGVGTWTATDAMKGGAVISLNGVNKFVVLAMFCTGHTWYKTFSDTTCHSRGNASEDGHAPPGGPQACPRHNGYENTSPAVTGPTCSLREAVLIIYDMADLQAGTDYSPVPEQIIYLQREWGVKHWFSGATQARAGEVSDGLWYEPTEQKLYWANMLADDVTQFGEKRPVIHVALVGTTSPSPSVPLPLTAGAALLVLCVPRRLLTRRPQLG